MHTLALSAADFEELRGASPELDAVARAAGASEDGLLREEAAAYLAATAARP